MLIFDLLTAPISLGVGGLTFILNQISDLANRELFDEGRIREDLLELQVRLEEGDVTEDEFRELEEEIMVRLRQARAMRQGSG